MKDDLAKDDATLTIEEHAATLCTEPWELRAMKVLHGWAQGKKITAAEFKAAQKAFWTCKLG